MGKGATRFLRVTIFLIGITILLLSVFLLPWLATYSAEMYPEYAYLQYPVLIGMYITVTPFFFALYQALKLLSYIDDRNAFSEMSVQALNYIKCSATIIALFYVLGSIFLITQNALHPGIAIVGFTIIFASVAIAVFSAVLQSLLKNALVIKTENDLTV